MLSYLQPTRATGACEMQAGDEVDFLVKVCVRRVPAHAHPTSIVPAAPPSRHAQPQPPTAIAASPACLLSQRAPCSRSPLLQPALHPPPGLAHTAPSSTACAGPLLAHRYPWQVIFLGDAAVGKTCLIEKLFSDQFSLQTQPTIGEATQGSSHSLMPTQCSSGRAMARVRSAVATALAARV